MKKGKNKNVLRNILIVILLAIISYFGGGKYISEWTTEIGEEIAERMTGQQKTEDKKPDKKNINGKIIQVSDGDTVILLDNDGTKHRVRLNGIDCPEIGQEHGEEARAFVKNLVLNKYVRLEVIGRDQYNRVLSVLYIDDTNVNEELLSNGLAWVYRFNNDKHYKELSAQAKTKKLNIWSKPQSLDPYIWRKQNKGSN